MNQEEEREYQERMGSPEMERLQNLIDFPEQRCDCGCHFSDFAYRGGKDCALCGHNH